MPMRKWSVSLYRFIWQLGCLGLYSNTLHGFHQLMTSMCFCQHIWTGMLPLKALPHSMFPREFMLLPAFTTNHDLSIIMKAGWIMPCWMITCWPHTWPYVSHYTLIYLFIALSQVWASMLYKCVHVFSIFLKVLIVDYLPMAHSNR